MVVIVVLVSCCINVLSLQLPPPQALRFSHRGTFEARVTRESRLPLRANFHRERVVWLRVWC